MECVYKSGRLQSFACIVCKSVCCREILAPAVIARGGHCLRLSVFCHPLSLSCTQSFVVVALCVI